ncbi:hypothetical protein O181_055500 [Austropuccinia psidii MF-1]|uniref:Uncharacterized protein n=1 Tax=Austropuccinia psidii MF-1 TaxID=1389203 RepID=A0A9Q3HVA7_9BASI|nr:hypothetical protein [Austropuccinia psidii MF-1]
MSLSETSKHNGFAKRANITKLEKAIFLLKSSDLPNSYWAEEVNTATLLRNLIPLHQDSILAHIKFGKDQLLASKSFESLVVELSYPFWNPIVNGSLVSPLKKEYFLDTRMTTWLIVFFD